MATINLDQFNQEVRYWGVQTTARLKAQARSLGIVHRSDSPSSSESISKIKDNYGIQAGIINRVGFKFPRNLIWTHKGAGKGKGGIKGSRWINAKGESKRTNPASFGKMGSGGRRAKPWFNNVMDSDQGVDQLATIAAEQLGDAITSKILI